MCALDFNGGFVAIESILEVEICFVAKFGEKEEIFSQ